MSVDIIGFGREKYKLGQELSINTDLSGLP